jgi:ATP-dependent Clp protease ATP-binding subunit ClpA
MKRSASGADLLREKGRVNMSMWAPFTEDARESIVRAQDVSTRTSGGLIGHEEIFVGVAQGPAVSALLAELGAGAQAVKGAVDAVLPRTPSSNQDCSWTPEAKRLLELAFEKARNLDNDFIASEHLLLAYLDVGSPGRAMLDALHIDPDDLREALIASLDTKPKHLHKGNPPSKMQKESFERVFRDAGALGNRRGPAQLWSLLDSAAKRKDVPGVAVCALAIAFREDVPAANLVRSMRKRAHELLDE